MTTWPVVPIEGSSSRIRAASFCWVSGVVRVRIASAAGEAANEVPVMPRTMSRLSGMTILNALAAPPPMFHRLQATAASSADSTTQLQPAMWARDSE